MATDHRERFAAIAAGPDDQIQLDEAALLIAAEAEGDVDVDARLEQHTQGLMAIDSKLLQLRQTVNAMDEVWRQQIEQNGTDEMRQKNPHSQLANKVKK